MFEVSRKSVRFDPNTTERSTVEWTFPVKQIIIIITLIIIHFI